jgi:hypothetical protein
MFNLSCQYRKKPYEARLLNYFDKNKKLKEGFILWVGLLKSLEKLF